MNDLSHQRFGRRIDIDASYTSGGIYFLLLRGDVVYVGQTRCLLRRMGQHRMEKTFDHIVFFEVEGDLDGIEQEMIRRFLPPLNKAHAPVTVLGNEARHGRTNRKLDDIAQSLSTLLAEECVFRTRDRLVREIVGKIRSAINRSRGNRGKKTIAPQ